MDTTGDARIRTRRGAWRVGALIATLTVIVSGLIGMGAPAASAAGSSCGPTINPIVCENSKPGTAQSVWDVDGAGDPSIQGFATDISVNAGSRIDFKIDTDARAYTIDIYRTGWYQGLGARFIQSVPVTAKLPQLQPQCISDQTTELYDCGTWGVSASWNVPSTAVSGVYVATLTRTDTQGSSQIIFIVRNDGNHSDVVFQTSDPTWQAYNTYGGSSFYQGGGPGRAFKLSYNRPFATRNWQGGRDFYFSSEFATVRFLERNGYDVSYLAGVDSDRRGSELLNHKVFMSVGHDEYWSAAQRANVTAARDAGVNLQFLTGNEVYWHTRYENAVDGSSTPYRTLVTYKETWANNKIDPAPEWTGTWRDPRFATTAQGAGLPENGLTGTMYKVNNSDMPITVNSAEGKLRIWRNTSLSSLASGASAQLAPHTVGYESDEIADNGFQPQGLVTMSTTTGPTAEYLTDYGNTVMPGTTTHHITMYKAASGALVFSSGSIQWGWGLDQTHDGNGAPADSRMQQAQVNLLADMGAQPSTLMSGLVAASKTTDTTPPTTVITSPSEGQSEAQGSIVTVTGTASDSGGQVAGVEVSTDGGATWHSASGRTQWTYSYVQQGLTSATIMARGIDDSGNFSATGTTRTVAVSGPASVFGSTLPTMTSSSDTSAVELGLRFTPATNGFITGVRFYKGSGNTGTHTGSLWDASGNRLATATFTNETASGWQTASFFSAVAVTAGTTYTISYSAPHGGYAYDEFYWPYGARPSTPLTVPSGVGSAAPGVFGTVGTFPTGTFHEANYYADALFEKIDKSLIKVSPITPINGSTSASLTGPISAQLSRSVTSSSVAFTVKDPSGATVAGTSSYTDATRTASFTPSAPLTPLALYTVALAATDANGVGLDSSSTWSFTTQAADRPAGVCPCTLYPESARPAIPLAGDATPVTLGMRFTVDSAGSATGVRYFKGAGAVGTRTGSLWSSTGTLLASATFTNESTSGWQQATFSSPVALTPNQQYTVSYSAPQGGYAVDPGAFSSSTQRGPIHVGASGGVFTYSSGAPTSTTSTSYFADVSFDMAAAPPTVLSTTPAVGSNSAAPGTTISAVFSSAIASGFTGTVTAAGAAVAGSWALSADAKTATFTPQNPLPAGALVATSLTGVVGTNGAAAQDTSWSFSVAGDSTVLTHVFFDGQTPQVTSATGDSSSVELGMSFTTSTPGSVTGVRFYKGSGNTGTHVGTLWGPSGQQLAQVTFVGETAAGWQRALFSTPVHIDPGSTYTVSYLAPHGGYAYTPQVFAAPVTSGPLTASSPNNGLYRYGSGGVRPTSSWNSTSYFVDVEFVADPVVTAVSPANGATGVDVGTTVSISFDQDVAGKTPTLDVSGAAGAVAGATSYTASTHTLTFTPQASLGYLASYTVTAKLAGQVVSAWSFRTVQQSGSAAPQTLFGTETPAAPTTADGTPVEVGTVFSVTQNAQVTAIRFYKETGNTGTHRGTLWSAAGQALAQVTFTNETATGWQSAQLSTPVSITPGQTYLVSVFDPNGKFSFTGGYFASNVTRGILTAPGGNNGRYFYGASGGIPNSSFNSASYFVDAEVVPMP